MNWNRWEENIEKSDIAEPIRKGTWSTQKKNCCLESLILKMLGFDRMTFMKQLFLHETETQNNDGCNSDGIDY